MKSEEVAARMRLPGRVVVCTCLVLLSIGLQGCTVPRIEGYFQIGSMDVPTHKVAIWRQKEELFKKYSYKQPSSGKTLFNSCMDAEILPMSVCGGNGFCEPFDRNNVANPTFFCKCDLGWAGPECNTKQKSQTIAWLLSLLLGPVGADQFYLDWPFWCAMKLIGFFIGCMLALLGYSRCGIMVILIYWFTDIVHIGSAPVRAADAKVAGDLPRWAFAVFTLLYFAFIGFGLGVCAVYFQVKNKRRMDDHQKYYGSMATFDHKVV